MKSRKIDRLLGRIEILVCKERRCVIDPQTADGALPHCLLWWSLFRGRQSLNSSSGASMEVAVTVT